MISFYRKIAGLSLACFLMIACAASAHRQCGYYHLNALMDAHPDIKATWQAERAAMIREAAALKERSALSKNTAAVDTIPVIFHVVINAAQLASIGDTAGIAARIASQIQVLNEDYAAANADLSHAPAPFLAIASATNIRFGLAHRDSSGNATPGYELRVISANGFDEYSNSLAGEAKHAATGGLNAWDNSKYLNIWVINFLDGSQPSGTLGLTVSFQYVKDYPSLFAPDEVGVLVNYGAFGLISAPQSATNYYTPLGDGNYTDHGRTLTHEVGHAFGMLHPWGVEQYGACPGSPDYQSADDDDGIADTPPQADPNYYTPTYPHISCGVTLEPHGDIFMDYMDYTDDTAMHLFTQDQAALMNLQITPGHESYSLTQHPELLRYPGEQAPPAAAQITVYPNPATGGIAVAVPQNQAALQSIYVTNMLGQPVLKMTGSNSGIYHLDLSSFAKGIYFVRCQFSGSSITQKILLQ